METEGNILQYIAGYICRQLKTKIERTNHKLKEELVLCLMDMTKDRDTEQWTSEDRFNGQWWPCTYNGYSVSVDLGDRNRNADPIECTY